MRTHRDKNPPLAGEAGRGGAGRGGTEKAPRLQVPRGAVASAHWLGPRLLPLQRARAAALLPRSLSLTLTDLQALQCKGKWCWHLLRNVGYIHGNNSLKCMSLLDY